MSLVEGRGGFRNVGEFVFSVVFFPLVLYTLVFSFRQVVPVNTLSRIGSEGRGYGYIVAIIKMGILYNQVLFESREIHEESSKYAFHLIIKIHLSLPVWMVIDCCVTLMTPHHQQHFMDPLLLLAQIESSADHDLHKNKPIKRTKGEL